MPVGKSGRWCIDPANVVSLTLFVEKPSPDQMFSDLANAGVLIVDPQLLAYVPPDGFFDIASDLLPCLLRQGVPIYAQPIEKSVYLIDIGSPEKYDRVQREWPTSLAARSMQGKD